MDVTRLLAFSAVALALIVMPGPSVLFVVSRAVSLGRRAALITVVGNAVGEFGQVMAVAVGVGAVVATSVTAFTVVKLLGAAYLIYLGVGAIRRRHSDTLPRTSPTRPRSHGRVAWQGLVVGATNPKSMVFFAAVLPQFVAPGLGHVPLQLLLLGLVWVGIALLSDSAWALVAGAARSWFSRSPRRLGRVQAGGGVVMIALGVGLALTSRSASS
ncbi:MAG TPA: LysE family translocator [Candidatus Dormibacteraeota bacterium]|nr:LysE family translocator [Candidatus Dormibacteraeota bacterium]